MVGQPIVVDLHRFYTADPFGNRIEILEAADGFLGRSVIARNGD